ncbi:MAG: hydroxymethylglutaryl-CoA reductase [archaeon GW2011_AR10]|uniref:3-hydroxy-3-methylglutaryl coenzyme A reductase n=1 Tax=Candidatus Iainarchaeum sp. TaxID=3101447 RepID=A0A7J4IUA4_9ARCH|nr:MAG: hydroxymethylglutaryl-CoA reductase [archaeon GW2011_AR10]HIH07929.1 hydroxymethylglutaryl-CoA reductase, degradative [Candidatus Diapherotrites archaeon]
MQRKDSRISGFYEKAIEERQEIVKEFAGLSEEEAAQLKNFGALGKERAQQMIENVVAGFELPMGIATNFYINGEPKLIPMVLEEPSVVAAASNAAKLSEGFETSSSEPIMIGQIQMVKVKNAGKAVKAIKKKEKELIEKAMAVDSTLVKFGGGPRKIEARAIKGMLIVHLLVDVRDAMGANAVNTMCERISPVLEEITGGKARLRILSNLAVHRTAKAKAVWKKEKIGGEAIEAILDAYKFAAADQFRATTHNKGIMNGVDAVAIATGNDFRAVEAGAHSFAAYKKKYSPLTKFYKNKSGDLVGEIELPLAVGTVGGATKTHPTAKIAVKILGVKGAQELAEIMAAVGLANNFAAMRALATEGIQRGHMKLHAKNIAIQAGAEGTRVEEIAKQLAEEKNINVGRAKEIIEGKKTKS